MRPKPMRGYVAEDERMANGRLERRKTPPFPTKQMFILALCRICEPIAFMSIFPYIYYMIEDFHITDSPSQISVYAGMVTSAFTLAEFSTGVMWGRLSDKVGRKPILLMGLIGTAISAIIFGFAQSLPVALFARAMGGLLNGNIGVLQTTVAELVTAKEHQPRAYTIMPLVWNIGSIIGPIIGGALARPCISYPNLFAKDTIWDRYPYLLPNVFSALTVCCGVAIGILFLEETHERKKYHRDAGIELGKHISAWFPIQSCKVPSRKAEKQPLLDEFDEYDGLPGYQTASKSPELTATAALQIREALEPLDVEAGVIKEEANKTIFTKPIILNIISYGVLAFHTMTYDSLYPVFLSSAPPEEKVPIQLPFKFVEGFGMDTKTIGVILSVQGLYSLASTVFMFPFVCERVGELSLFRFTAVTYFLLYFFTPYLVLLPENLQMPGIYLAVIWKCTFSTMAYPSNAILLTNSAPDLLSLGTINGIAASTASLARALGPTIAGFLYALGLRSGYSGLAWWCSGAVTLIGAVLSMSITEGGGRFNKAEQAAIPTTTEPVANREGEASEGA